MALDEAPPFWWQDISWQAWLLSPISFVYGRAAGKRMDFAASASVDVPVICVGNFIVGGAGKTPTVELLSKFVRTRGMRPGILTRGHGGAITAATVVKRDHHNAHDVGDEALLHAAHAITVVSADRPSGAAMLVKHGCDVILMDDGFQNPSLEKDFSLVVVDAKRGLGNGFTMPSGPMRVPFRHQLLYADTVIVIGDGKRGDNVIRQCARAGKPILKAAIKAKGKLLPHTYFAYAGIADPSKFFDTLSSLGTDVKGTQAFGDHHFFRDEECADLMAQAKRMNARLLTTAKDAARLKGMGQAQEKLLEASDVLNVELQTEDASLIENILDIAIENATQRRLKSKKRSRQKATA
ncbi:MAG: tetraacyldisaccharide 4'-kinase [Pseudomonadota bacterium]